MKIKAGELARMRKEGIPIPKMEGDNYIFDEKLGKKRPKPPEGYIRFRFRQFKKPDGTKGSPICPNCNKPTGFVYFGGLRFTDKNAAKFAKTVKRNGNEKLFEGTYINNHWSRYSEGKCMGCGAKLWHDFIQGYNKNGRYVGSVSYYLPNGKQAVSKKRGVTMENKDPKMVEAGRKAWRTRERNKLVREGMSEAEAIIEVEKKYKARFGRPIAETETEVKKEKKSIVRQEKKREVKELKLPKGVNPFGTYPSATKLRDVFGLLSSFSDEAIVKLNTGMSLEFADRAMVSTCSLKIDGKGFDKLGKIKTDVGLNLLTVVDILKKANGNSVKFSVDGKDRKLLVDLIGGPWPRRFVAQILDIESEDLPPIKNLEFASTFDVPMAFFERVIKDLGKDVDGVIFEINNGKFTVTTDDGYKIENEVDGKHKKAKCKYSLEYMNRLVNGTKKLFDTVTVNMKSNYPAKFEFSNRDRDIDFGFVLAPRSTE